MQASLPGSLIGAQAFNGICFCLRYNLDIGNQNNHNNQYQNQKNHSYTSSTVHFTTFHDCLYAGNLPDDHRFTF